MKNFIVIIVSAIIYIVCTGLWLSSTYKAIQKERYIKAGIVFVMPPLGVIDGTYQILRGR